MRPPPRVVWAAANTINNAQVGTVYKADDISTSTKEVTIGSLPYASSASIATYNDTYGKPFGEISDFNNTYNKYANDDNACSTIKYNIESRGSYTFYILSVEYSGRYPVISTDSTQLFDGGHGYDPSIDHKFGNMTNPSSRQLTCFPAFTKDLEAGEFNLTFSRPYKTNNGTEEIQPIQGVIAVVLVKNDSTSPQISFGDNSSYTFVLGKSETPKSIDITANLTNIPKDATISWTSDNTEVATVTETSTASNGQATATVTPVDVGTATITASYTDADSNTYSADYSVTVRNVDYGQVVTVDGVSTTLTVGRDSSTQTVEYTVDGNGIYRTEGLHNQRDNTATLSNIDLSQYNYDKVEVYVSQGNNNYINATIKVGETEVAVVNTEPTGGWNTFQTFSADLTNTDASGQVTFTCAQRASGDNHNSGNYVYVRFYNSKAAESTEWTNLSSAGDAFSNATVAQEGEETVYSLQNALKGAGFSYNLTDKITDLSENLSNLTSGYLTVSADISVNNPNRDYFIDLSSNDVIPGYGNGNNNIYGRIAGNSSWSNARLCGGTNGTLSTYAISSKINNDGTWTRVSFVVDYKDIQNITMAYDGEYREVARTGYEASNFGDNLYLNIRPTTETGTTIKVKNISAVYSTTEPIHSGFGATYTDSGYYGENQNGVIRFMQGYSGGPVTNYGFYFLDSTTAEILESSFIRTDGDLEADGFYGDLYDIPKSEYSSNQNFLAKGFVTQNNSTYTGGNQTLGETSTGTYFGNAITGTVGEEEVAYPEATEAPAE